MVCFVWFIWWCGCFVVLGWLGCCFGLDLVLLVVCCAGGFGDVCALVAGFVVLVVGYFVACDSWFALGYFFWFICILFITWVGCFVVYFVWVTICVLVTRYGMCGVSVFVVFRLLCFGRRVCLGASLVIWVTLVFIVFDLICLVVSCCLLLGLLVYLFAGELGLPGFCVCVGDFLQMVVCVVG